MNHPKITSFSEIAKRPPLVVLFGDYTQLRGLAQDHDLSEELDRAIVVPSERMPSDVVTMHSRCIYIDENVGVQREIELVYPDEADPNEGKVSVLAPIGSALLGLAAGQSIDWELPGGRIHRLRLLRVVHQPNVSTETPEAHR